MESTCQTNRIQLSNTTTDLLKQAGRGSWIAARQDVVIARGLGALSTYWLTIKDGASGTSHSSCLTADHQIRSKAVRKARHHERLVAWMTELLGLYIQQVLAHRQGKLGEDINYNGPERGDLLSETVAVIHLPKFDSSNCSATGEQDYTKFALDSDIVSLLHDFVAKIASMYRKNPFHNFGTSSLNRVV